jgi:biotin synthase
MHANPAAMPGQASPHRHDWSRQEVERLLNAPLNDLLFEAQTVHRRHHQPNQVQLSTLLSIKTGACPEDCGYCPQSAHHAADLEREALMDVEAVVSAARAARDAGASRFCMGAAWRSPREKAKSWEDLKRIHRHLAEPA